MDAKETLKTVNTVLVIDWPSRDVPESLVRAGFHVVVHGGPGSEDYWVYELRNGKVEQRRTGRRPERADLIYSHRPFSELPGIIATAPEIAAKTIWTQSGFSAAGVKGPRGCWLPDEDLRSAQGLVLSAGLNYIAQPYIGDTAREIAASR